MRAVGIVGPFAIVCGALALSACGPTEDAAASARVERGLVFARRDTGALRLDLHRPPGDAPAPVVVLVPGGGWRKGERALAEGDAGFLVAAGFAAAPVDHRASDVAVFPAQIHDLEAAVRWLRREAPRLGLDPQRIAVMGRSSGGHLAALLGTAADAAALDAPGAARTSARVQAVVDFYGPADLARVEAWQAPGSIASRLLGGPVGERLAEAARASPIPWASADDPPFLIVHGDRDRVVPLDQSERLARALEAAGVEVTLHVVRDGRHGRGGAFGSAALRERVIAFLDAHLRP